MDIEATIIKKRITTVICKVSNLPIISVGLVKILSKSSNFKFKNASEPMTIKTEKNENIIRFKSKLRFPFSKFFSSFTYLEKSPKLIIIIEKYAKIVPATVMSGAKLLISKKFPKFKIVDMNIDTEFYVETDDYEKETVKVMGIIFKLIEHKHE